MEYINGGAEGVMHEAITINGEEIAEWQRQQLGVGRWGVTHFGGSIGGVQHYGTGLTDTSGGVEVIGVPICPDLLRHSQLGEADNARGRVVRAFFWLLRFWPDPA